MFSKLILYFCSFHHSLNAIAIIHTFSIGTNYMYLFIFAGWEGNVMKWKREGVTVPPIPTSSMTR